MNQCLFSWTASLEKISPVKSGVCRRGERQGANRQYHDKSVPAQHRRLTPCRSGLLTTAVVIIPLMLVGAAKAEKPNTSNPTHRTVLMIAGPPSHAYGAHEHYAGLKVLEESVLDAAPKLDVNVLRGWPQDESKIDAADVIVLYCDGGGRHLALNHRDSIENLLRRGGGLVALHYAVEMVPGAAGDDWVRLLGGHFEINRSVNPHWTAEFKSLPEHPITTGVPPFDANDEWYFHMRFSEQGKWTPILQAVAPESTMRRPDGAHTGNPSVRKSVAAGEQQTVAWAYEPPFGGRSFGFTGGHFHWNWGREPFRRVVTNAILWAADEKIQPSVQPMRTIGAEELLINQDFSPPKSFSLEGVVEKFGIPGSSMSDKDSTPSVPR